MSESVYCVCRRCKHHSVDECERDQCNCCAGETRNVLAPVRARSRLTIREFDVSLTAQLFSKLVDSALSEDERAGMILDFCWGLYQVNAFVRKKKVLRQEADSRKETLLTKIMLDHLAVYSCLVHGFRTLDKEEGQKHVRESHLSKTKPTKGAISDRVIWIEKISEEAVRRDEVGGRLKPSQR